MLSRLHHLPRGVARATRALSSAAYVYSAPGAPAAVLAHTSIDTPDAAQPGNVIVKWLAAGVDPVDLATVADHASTRSIAPAALPAVPGSEGVAVVTSAASNVSSLREGDYVIPIKPSVGTWRMSSEIAETDVISVPSSSRLELLATLSNSPFTALRLLSDFAALQEGDVVVQNNAGAPVGTAVAQLGAALGLRVVSVVSEAGADYAPTVERLKLLGSEVGVGEPYLDTPGVRAVLDDLPAPKLALNGGSAASCARLASVLPSGTPLVTYSPGEVDSGAVSAAGLAAQHFSLGDWLRAADRAAVQDMVEKLVGYIDGGSLTAWLQRVKFDDLPHAIKEGGHTRRKLVAMMDH